MIAFLQPLALLGLAAAAIPAILHFLAKRVPPTVWFPAVRYLEDTEREQSRRLKLRHLLLLILRTALIVCVVLAAARPVADVGLGSAHPPTALGLVVDNSLSSAAIVEGRRVLDRIVEKALEVIGKLAEQDQLWVVTADGVVRRTGRLEALELVRALDPLPRRLDLGQAVRLLDRVVSAAPLAEREIVVLSDLQRTAWSAGDTAGARVLLWRPAVRAVNRSVDSARSEPSVWTSHGEVVVALGGNSEIPAAVRLEMNGREIARSVARAGDRLVMSVTPTRRGWQAGVVRTDPDELRLDDDWYLAVRVAEPAEVTVESGAGRYVAEALEVLGEGGRVRLGGGVIVSDRVAGTRTVVFPPSDGALVGNLNRQLAARGLTLRVGERIEGEWRAEGEGLAGVQSEAAGGWITVKKRHRLSGGEAVLARAGGEPWMVREGGVILIGSRLEEDWTDLPVSAWFVPFLDVLVNRLAAGEVRVVNASPGEAVRLPPGAVRAVGPNGAVEGDAEGAITAPVEPGVYFFVGAAGDTAGALQVNHDSRESRLDPVDARVVRGTLGTRARLVGDRALSRELFGGAARADLTLPFLLLALALAAVELIVASLGTRQTAGKE
ncbi:hypothetical protein HRbin33_02694 [bacterium HR33]|nr:hypothetical protein HRbin33_02694 [bacterium HR33]